MTTKRRKETEFRGEPILDRVLAQPLDSYSNVSTRPAKVAAPASTPAHAPREGGAVTSPSTKSPTRDPRQAYLEAIAALADARLALIEAERALPVLRGEEQAAVEEVREAVEALGHDSLGILGPRSTRSRRDPEAFLQDALALLPARPGEIAAKLGVRNRSNVARLLARAEALGLVRREPDRTARPGVGRPGYVWHRVDVDGDGDASA